MRKDLLGCLLALTFAHSALNVPARAGEVRWYSNIVEAISAAKETNKPDMGLNSLEVKDGKQAADTFEKCLKEFPNSRHQPQWTLNLARAYAIAEKKDKAKKLLDEFIGQHPGSTDSERAKALLDSL